MAMLELALADVDGIIVDPRELHAGQRGYTFDTLDAMQREMPDAEFTLIIGSDQFNVFNTWHRWQELLQLAVLAVMERPGEALSGTAENLLSGDHADQIRLLKVTQLEISSSRIRRDLQQGREIRFLLPYAVRNYIADNRLYIDGALPPYEKTGITN